MYPQLKHSSPSFEAGNQEALEFSCLSVPRSKAADFTPRRLEKKHQEGTEASSSRLCSPRVSSWYNAETPAVPDRLARTRTACSDSASVPLQVPRLLPF